jgi:hypothetical protein
LDWSDAGEATHARELMYEWAVPAPADALELLGPAFSDEVLTFLDSAIVYIC